MDTLAATAHRESPLPHAGLSASEGVEVRPRIPVLVPDMPSARDLRPWLERIDAVGRYTNFGPLVTEFESWIATQLGDNGDRPHVIAASSGSMALELAFAAMNLRRGGKVLLPTLTFPATAAAAIRSGLMPVLTDVDCASWMLTPVLARQAATILAPVLVVPVATYGRAVDATSWDAFVEETGIPVLVDAAAAFGNQRLGRHICTVFSFHATKPFGIGEGGALVTYNSDIAERARRLSNFGFARGVAETVGMNAKLSEYAAAVGLAQSLRWPESRRRRVELWRGYASALAALSGVSLQEGLASDVPPAKLMIRLSRPAAEMALALSNAGIETRGWYLPPLHLHTAFSGCQRCGWDGVDALRVADALSVQGLGLPWFASMTPEQCGAVVAALERGLASRDSIACDV